MTIDDKALRESENASTVVNLLAEMEIKLKQNIFQPEHSDAVRFCVSQIILKAIALSKDPKVDITRVKDLYNLASEILAHGDLKTEAEEQRLTDLINSMVEKDDIGLNMGAIRKEVKSQFNGLEAKQNLHYNLLAEQLLENATKTEVLSRAINKLLLKNSTLHIFLVTLVTLSILLFTIVTAGAIIAYILVGSNQPDFTKKESMFQKERFYSNSFASLENRSFNPKFIHDNTLLYENKGN